MSIGRRKWFDRFLCRLACLLLSMGILASGNAGVFGSTETSDAKGLISIDMVDADVRDILSSIALGMNVSVLYLGEPVRVTFSAKEVSSMDALKLLVQSLGTKDEQMGYLEDGNVIIVGSQQKLQKDFFNQMALTRFRVGYISPEILSEQLDKLGVPVQKITLDKSSNFIWAQGTPQALAKVASVIGALDKAENFTSDGSTVKSGIDLTPFQLDYITAERLDALIQQLKIPAQTIKIDTNPMMLWANGSQQAITDIEQLILKVDIAQSEGKVFDMTSYNMKYLTYEKLTPIVTQLKLPVEIIRVGAGKKNLWIKGTQKDIQDLKALIVKLDIADNSAENQFFIYSLANISPRDAAARLDFLAIGDVIAFTLNYPQLSHELLISCPEDMTGSVLNTLAKLDVQGSKIKAPVDYSENYYKLSRKRALISQLLGTPLTSIFISEDISRKEDTSYYIMWVEETPDNINKIKEMVKWIDNPLKD